MEKRCVSIELERALVYQSNSRSYPPGGNPFGSATPFSFRSFLSRLLSQGWQPILDPTTGVVIRVKKPRLSPVNDAAYWTCTSDVTTGILETTLPPKKNLFSLEKEQRHLDKEILPLLAEEGLFIWYTETTPVTPATREYYTLFHTYWRGEYAHLRHRAMDHYWFSWTIGNNPSLDISVQEAIPFLRLVIRLTGITFFFLRSGAISGGKLSPGGMLTVRPWAWKNLFLKSPYATDLDRIGMPEKEIISWPDYFSYLMNFRLLTLFLGDGKPYRISSDPSFWSFWQSPPLGGWDAVCIDGQRSQVLSAELTNLEGLQRQTYVSRLRFKFSPPATLEAFGSVLKHDHKSLEKWLENNLTKLYIEVRSDGCPPKKEEFSTLALYLGLLTNLKNSFEYIVNGFSYDFWKRVFAQAIYAPLDSKVDDVWIPELMENIVSLAQEGLKKRRLGEEKFLQPLTTRIRRKTTPAEQALEIFKNAGEGKRAIGMLAQTYGLFPEERS